MKFEIAGKEVPVEPTIVFSTYLDGNGSFVVTANGENLLSIDVDSGTLYRFYRTETGLATDEHGRIVVIG